MMSSYGTPYFLSAGNAYAYYKSQFPQTTKKNIEWVNHKLNEKEIFIGRPKLKSNEFLSIIKGEGRYQINIKESK